MKSKLFTFCFFLSSLPVYLYGQTSDIGANPVYKRGETVLESTLSPSPESASRVKFADVPFTHSMGLAEYEIPFTMLQGRELAFPIGLRYRSGGIKMEETAGVAGLGWTLEAGGCVTRTVMDMPDEFSNGRLMQHQMPSDTGEPSLDYLRKVVWHRIDAQLDMYKYAVCGLSGSFVIKDDGTVFLLSGDGVKVTYSVNPLTGDPLSFTLVGPDGTKYICSEREYTTHDGYNYSPPTPLDGEKDIWRAVTSWHVTKVQSRSGLESASFAYTATDSIVVKRNSRIDSFSLTSPGDYNSSAGSISTPQTTQVFHPKVLTRISLGEFSLHLTYAGGTGNDNLAKGGAYKRPNFPVRLSGITLSHTKEGQLDSLFVGTERDTRDGRIVLKDLRRYRHGVLDNRWDFEYYKGYETIVNRASKDWFGYCNAEYNYSTITTPPEHLDDPLIRDNNDNFPGLGGTSGSSGSSGSSGTSNKDVAYNPPFEAILSTIHTIKHGFPVAGRAEYMSLSKADHDGVVTTFEYEQGAPPAGLPSSKKDLYNVGIRVKRIKTSAGGKTMQTRSFKYENPQADGPVRPTLNMYLTVAPPKTQMIGTMLAKTTWTFSLHDNPVTNGPSIQDTKVFWGKITETVSDLTKSIYHYNTGDVFRNEVSTIAHFPQTSFNFYNSFSTLSLDPWTAVQQYYVDANSSSPPRLERVEHYALDGESYKLTESQKYEYEYEVSLYQGQVMTGYIARQVNQDVTYGSLRPQDIYHYPVMTSPVSNYRPTSILTVGYHNSGNDSTRVSMTYVSRSTLEKPSRIASVSTTEGGVQRRLSYTYPDTVPLSQHTQWQQQLLGQHCLTSVLKKNYFVKNLNSALKSEQWTYADFNGALLPQSHKEYYKGQECWHETVLSRDPQGNVTSIKEKGKPLTNIKWGHNGMYPVEIRQDSLTTHYDYRPGTGLISMTDPSGVMTTYDYDYGNRLIAIRDENGHALQSWTYHLFNNNNGDGHLYRNHKVFRAQSEQNYSEDITWWNTLGLKEQNLHIKAAGDGRNLVVAYESDGLLRDDARIWVPYPIDASARSFQKNAATTAAASHSNTKAYYSKHYENSHRNLVLSEALPGFDTVHENIRSTDVCETPFPKYLWDASSSIAHTGTYHKSEILVQTVTDADGRTKSTFSDHLGRTLATKVGKDSLTYYTYDNEDRVISIRRGDYITETEYDSLGRPAMSYLTVGNTPRQILEEHTYTLDRETAARYAVLTQNSDEDYLYVSHTYQYDDRGRPALITTNYPDGTVLKERLEYNLAGEVIGQGCSFKDKTIYTQILRDSRGRPIASSSYLTTSGLTQFCLNSQYHYDSLGRACGKKLSSYLSSSVDIQDKVDLRGWPISRVVSKNNDWIFKDNWAYTINDGTVMSPKIRNSYTGLVLARHNSWRIDNSKPLAVPDTYKYDYSGRLSEETTNGKRTSIKYDSRGNIRTWKVNNIGMLFTYDGDKLIKKGNRTFDYDEVGRMIHDGASGVDISYNALNLPSKIKKADNSSVEFHYLADRTKLSVINDDGTGLEYRGPFVYRKDASGEVIFESAACPEGRLTESASLLYVPDFLGSVRIVMDASNGTVLEASDYSAFGTRTPKATSTLPAGLTLRDHFTGCEDLKPDFNIPYADHAARYYSPSLQRWMVPDPLSEKYYGISPYAYCNNNPLSFTDVNGAAVFYTQGGNRIGYDGIDDGGLYLVPNSFEPLSPFYLRLLLNSGLQDSSFEKLDRLIIQTRYKENDQITVSKFMAVNGYMVDDINESDYHNNFEYDNSNMVMGFILEPEGPDTILENQNKRIPEGIYNLASHSGKKYQNTYKLYNDLVPQDRYILYHIGNTRNNTKGCHLLGTRFLNGTVENSGNKFNELMDFLRPANVKNIRTIIRNSY